MNLDITYYKVPEKTDASNQKKNYTLEDCILVRTTDIFPKNHIVQTNRNAMTQTLERITIFKNEIVKRIRKKYPDNMNEAEKANYFKELDQYDIYKEFYRSTIHFTINGLVSSHLYGNFDNRPFIILEPLMYHIHDKSIEGLRVEDTYFSDDMKLSNECIILISQEYFDSNKSNLELLENLKGYKVIVFDGDEKIAVQNILHQLGYNAFEISEHGYLESNYISEMDKYGRELRIKTEEGKMNDFIYDYAKANNISIEPHCYSDIYYKDANEMYTKSLNREKDLLLFIINSVGISDELKEELLYYIEYSNMEKLIDNPLISQLIDEIGLEPLKELIGEYNKNCILELENIKNSKNK